MSTTRPRYSRPRKLRDWKSITRIAIIPVLALGCVVGFFYGEHSFQRDKQTHWTTLAANVVATRMEPITQHALEYGGSKLYEVDVLVIAPLHGTPQYQWLAVSQPPRSFADAKAQMSALNKQQCFVRWDPAHPDEKIVELH